LAVSNSFGFEDKSSFRNPEIQRNESENILQQLKLISCEYVTYLDKQNEMTFLSRFGPILKGTLFFEAAGEVLKNLLEP